MSESSEAISFTTPVCPKWVIHLARFLSFCQGGNPGKFVDLVMNVTATPSQ
jgi:hypothetical protein